MILPHDNRRRYGIARAARTGLLGSCLVLAACMTPQVYADLQIEAECDLWLRCYKEAGQTATHAQDYCDALRATPFPVCVDDYFDADNAASCIESWQDLNSDDDCEEFSPQDASCAEVCVAPV